MQCFLLSVVCNHFIGRNKVVFCIFGMAQGKPRVGVFHSHVYLGQWQSDHKLPPGQLSVDWTNLLLLLHHGCHWKAERAPRTTSVVSQGVGMHWESPNGLVNRLRSRPRGWTWPSGLVGGPGLLCLWWAWGMQGCWSRGHTLRNMDLGNARTESDDMIVFPSPFLFQLSWLSDFMHALITSLPLTTGCIFQIKERGGGNDASSRLSVNYHSILFIVIFLMEIKILHLNIIFIPHVYLYLDCWYQSSIVNK